MSDQPSSTYRVQFTPEFTFEDAQHIVDYLRELGISDLYASPVFQARQGSSHGYDVTDPTRLNEELGGPEAWALLTEALQQAGMGLLMDIVPNHMAANSQNVWWWSVLENGPSSEYATFFDIVWHPGATGVPMDNQVLLPILGNHYGSVLENRELQIQIDDDGGLSVNYYENKLPLDPKTYRLVLEQRYGTLKDRLAIDAPLLREYEQLIELTDAMPDRAETDPDAIEQRRRQTGHLKAELHRLYTEHELIREFIDENLELVNGEQGNPASFDTLDRLLSDQAYRLAFWRVASTEINYRRFFDIADLVSMRIEDDEVFTARHRPLLQMARDGEVTGLRIDHIDGLRDPQQYLERLQAFIRQAFETRPGDQNEFYVVAEKILSEGEKLPDEWPAAGTTGYDYLNLVNGVFVYPGSREQLDALFRRVSGVEQTFEEVVYQQKRRVMADLFSGDVRGLVVWLDRLTAFDRYGRDLTQRELGQALTELTARFPIYRTYTRSFDIRDEDRANIERALDESAAARPELGRAFRFLRRVLLLQFPSYIPDEHKQDWLDFVLRWQQFTGPIMAKGYEDTALYIYNRLISLNDVGGEPDTFGVSVEEFHATNRERMDHWPHTMNATSTHDTKRSEDVRARVNVISELADEWASCVDRWRAMNESCKRVSDGKPTPDGNTEYLIYQTVGGAWPLTDADVPSFVERVKGYLMKATREAKVHTSWINPNEEYEGGINAFIDDILAPNNREFLDDLHAFTSRTAWFGALNSLSQALLKVTSPGVPDIYQGTELWDYSLVDPDNRRPVDYDLRRRLLAELRSPTVDVERLLGRWKDGVVKLHVIQRVLKLRRERRELFDTGAYVPLEVSGGRREHVVAFARRSGDDWAIVVAPRFYARLAESAGLSTEQPPVGDTAWGDTVIHLPDDAPPNWCGVLAEGQLSGSELRLAEVLRKLPVEVLTNAL